MKSCQQILCGLTTVLLGAFGYDARSQCANDNTYWQTTSPVCPGTTVASTCLFGGEYQLINVVAGNTYTFSTCGTTLWDTQITLYNNAGGAALGFNDDGCGLQSTITWTATFTGQLRVLIDTYPCASNISCATLTVGCTSGVPPTGDCIYYLNLFDSFGDGWGSSNVGISINGGPYQYYTVTGATNSIPIGVNVGNVVTLTYNNSGTFQGENSYSLTLGGSAVFNSGTPPAAGLSYAGTVTCNPPPSPPEDCIGGITICSGQSFNNNTNNTGNVADLNLTSAGCLGALERQGTWYNFAISSGGQVAFTLNPTDPFDDYDFAIWGPFPPGSTPGGICPPLGTPLRCSFAAPPGPTGLNYTATDWSEPPSGDKWVQYIPVTTGQVYLMYISNFSQSGLEFSLSWNLAGGASLDCTQLSVELTELEAKPETGGIRVDWTTVSERQCSHFAVERSADGTNFLPIGQLNGQGDSDTPVAYSFLDDSPHFGVNYYRLLQVDVDGSSTRSNTVMALHGSLLDTPVAVPNPAGDHTTILVRSSSAGPALLDLLDSRGRVVITTKPVLAEGPNRIELSLAGLEAGSYWIQMRLIGGQTVRSRLVKYR